MSLILFIFMPICCALTGKLLGLSVAASCLWSDHGTRIGKIVSGWCTPLLPIVYLVLLFAGGSGSAGTGMRLFDSEVLFGLACGIPLYAIPVLGFFVGAMYVVRDLALNRERV